VIESLVIKVVPLWGSVDLKKWRPNERSYVISGGMKWLTSDPLSFHKKPINKPIKSYKTYKSLQKGANCPLPSSLLSALWCDCSAQHVFLPHTIRPQPWGPHQKCTNIDAMPLNLQICELNKALPFKSSPSQIFHLSDKKLTNTEIYTRTSKCTKK
jgi:hypothetical protein